MRHFNNKEEEEEKGAKRLSTIKSLESIEMNGLTLKNG